MKKKLIAMIPVRLGSKRIPKKNLRLINGKPLVSYIIEAAKESNIFDEIYLNSESEEFLPIVEEHGIKFYKRPDHLSTDSATNDDFALDFINNTDGDILIQLLATSPFINGDEIKGFVKSMLENNYNTQILVKNEQIECLFNDEPINFIQKDKTLPSQMLKPIQVYACGIMGWDTEIFKHNMKTYGSAYHGGDGTIGTYSIKGYSTIDIDNEEDFDLAESVFRSFNTKKIIEYYTPKKFHSESDVPSILHRDGVVNNDFDHENMEICNVESIIMSKDMRTSWSHRVINSENNSATLICQLPGEGNRRHYHNNWNEWWYILEGEWDFEIDGIIKKIYKNDIVFIEKNKIHKIMSSGNGPAIRLAVSREDVDHIYVDEKKEINENSTISHQRQFWETYLNKRFFTSEDISNWIDGDSYFRTILTNNILPKIDNKTVLEIGCLTGKWIKELNLAKRVIGVDLFEVSEKYIRSKYPQITNFEFYKTSGNELNGIDDNSVDFIYSIDSLIRLDPIVINDYINEVYRVLKKGGEAFLHLPCTCSLKSTFLNFTKISEDEIKEYSLNAGFTEILTDHDIVDHGIILKLKS